MQHLPRNILRTSHLSFIFFFTPPECLLVIKYGFFVLFLYKMYLFKHELFKIHILRPNLLKRFKWELPVISQIWPFELGTYLAVKCITEKTFEEEKSVYFCIHTQQYSTSERKDFKIPYKLEHVLKNSPNNNVFTLCNVV